MSRRDPYLYEDIPVLRNLPGQLLYLTFLFEAFYLDYLLCFLFHQLNMLHKLHLD